MGNGRAALTGSGGRPNSDTGGSTPTLIVIFRSPGFRQVTAGPLLSLPERAGGLSWDARSIDCRFLSGGCPTGAGRHHLRSGAGGKSGVSSSFWGEIRCQFIILARKDELTPDFLKDELTPDFLQDFLAKRRTGTGFPSGLNGAARASQGPGDRGGGVALLGQDDGLMTQPDPFLREGFGQSLKFFEAVMALDKHRSSSWCDSDAQSILPNRHNPWNRSARIFRTWYNNLSEEAIQR